MKIAVTLTGDPIATADRTLSMRSAVDDAAIEWALAEREHVAAVARWNKRAARALVEALEGADAMNRAIHCACGLVFSTRPDAAAHMLDPSVHANPFDHTIIDETATAAELEASRARREAEGAIGGPPGETPTIALARQRIAALVTSLGDVRTEIVRAQLVMDKRSAEYEAARQAYEGARKKLVEIDAELEVEVRALVAHVEAGP